MISWTRWTWEKRGRTQATGEDAWDVVDARDAGDPGNAGEVREDAGHRCGTRGMRRKTRGGRMSWLSRGLFCLQGPMGSPLKLNKLRSEFLFRPCL